MTAELKATEESLETWLARTKAEVRAEPKPAVAAVRRLPVVWEQTTEQPHPVTREDCEAGGELHVRPCPWVSCKHNLYLEVTPAGSLKLLNPDILPEEMDPAESCVLDLAEGETTLEEIGRMLGGVTRERIRQIEANGLRKLRVASVKNELFRELRPDRELTRGIKPESAAMLSPNEIRRSILKNGDVQSRLASIRSTVRVQRGQHRTVDPALLAQLPEHQERVVQAPKPALARTPKQIMPPDPGIALLRDVIRRAGDVETVATAIGIASDYLSAIQKKGTLPSSIQRLLEAYSATLPTTSAPVRVPPAAIPAALPPPKRPVREPLGRTTKVRPPKLVEEAPKPPVPATVTVAKAPPKPVVQPAVAKPSKPTPAPKPSKHIPPPVEAMLPPEPRAKGVPAPPKATRASDTRTVQVTVTRDDLRLLYWLARAAKAYELSVVLSDSVFGDTRRT